MPLQRGVHPVPSFMAFSSHSPKLEEKVGERRLISQLPFRRVPSMPRRGNPKVGRPFKAANHTTPIRHSRVAAAEFTVVQIGNLRLASATDALESADLCCANRFSAKSGPLGGQ